jgi:hypothetical protein
MESFWQRFLPGIYPNDQSGPYLVSLQSKKDLSAAVLNALQEKGPSGSPEPISPEAMKLIQEEWSQLRRVGILRFMKGRESSCCGTSICGGEQDPERSDQGSLAAFGRRQNDAGRDRSPAGSKGSGGRGGKRQA